MEQWRNIVNKVASLPGLVAQSAGQTSTPPEQTVFDPGDVCLIDLRLIRNVLTIALDINPAAPSVMAHSFGPVLEGQH